MATADVAMEDMDIDLDGEVEEDQEIARLQAEADAINARAEVVETEAMNGVEEAEEEGEVSETSAQPTKVHIRGLDKMNTFDLERLVEEQGCKDLFRKVQWIDDTSANLIFDTEVAASDALIALSAEETADIFQLRPSKRVSSHPEQELQVRQAIVADVKVRGAKDRSAFYLFNKEWDPDNPENVRPDNRKRRWVDDGQPGRNKYRRRDRSDDRLHRRGSRDHSRNFTEDMYDEGPSSAPTADLERHGYSSGSEHGRRRRTNYDGDLFSDRRDRRLRDRSASPTRDGDGRYGFSEDQPQRRTARARSQNPPGICAGRDNRTARDTLRKELFPSKATSSYSALAKTTDSTRPDRSPTRVELFPDRASTPSHRRQDAKDLDPDEVADAIGKYTLREISDTQVYTYSLFPGRRPERPDLHANGGRIAVQGRDLFSRIKDGPKVESSHGRLNGGGGDAGFSIKGAGQQQDEGFSFRGASKGDNPLVKELFPLKSAKPGAVDLFDGKIKGRGAQRRRAEDLF